MRARLIKENLKEYPYFTNLINNIWDGDVNPQNIINKNIDKMDVIESAAENLAKKGIDYLPFPEQVEYAVIVITPGGRELLKALGKEDDFDDGNYIKNLRLAKQYTGKEQEAERKKDLAKKQYHDEYNEVLYLESGDKIKSGIQDFIFIRHNNDESLDVEDSKGRRYELSLAQFLNNMHYGLIKITKRNES